MFKTLFTVTIAALASTSYTFGVDDTIATLAGFMSAVVHKDHLNEMLTCATDAELLTGDVEALIADVESLTFSGIFKAIETTGKIFGEAPFVLRECENLQDDLKTLGEQAKIFLNIGELTERITKNYVWHYGELMTDIANAKADAAAGQYYNFGEQIGEAVMVALQP